MKILNSADQDFHIHSLNFSDGFNTIDEIVQFAYSIGLKKIVITDHSQALLDACGFGMKTFRGIISRWKNVHNDLDVTFGVEADLLTRDGDICSHIQGTEGDFVILSYHKETFQGSPEEVQTGFINAMRRFQSRINFIGHVCTGITTQAAQAVIQEANTLRIPLEINGKQFLRDPASWEVALEMAEQVYINSDAHTLYELKAFPSQVRDILAKRSL